MKNYDEDAKQAILDATKEAGYQGESLPHYTIDKPYAVQSYYEAAKARQSVLEAEGVKNEFPIDVKNEENDIKKAIESEERKSRANKEYNQTNIYEKKDDYVIDALTDARDSGFMANDIPDYVKQDLTAMKQYREGVKDARTDMDVGALESGRNRRTEILDDKVYVIRNEQINELIKEHEIKHAKEAQPKTSYFGTVESIKDNVAFQRTDEGMVKHDLTNMSPKSAVEKIKENRQYDFKYPSGKAGLMKEAGAHEKKQSAQHTFER